ncbi:hypothetical protein [Brevibacillus laterosporus]|uniref:hypothetical protein n=1 Tax=Brevibacillus laterosporus TaxID=1465 RepID=UPI0018CD7514|nr:hypothetical protein [Brevibacillus laterosporus]MBG9796544.1 hypothetical protein [Brevibacillus laterosporus]MED1913584.1 hypothetical protein [Brevibacillus laterosporus]
MTEDSFLIDAELIHEQWRTDKSDYGDSRLESIGKRSLELAYLRLVTLKVANALKNYSENGDRLSSTTPIKEAQIVTTLLNEAESKWVLLKVNQSMDILIDDSRQSALKLYQELCEVCDDLDYAIKETEYQRNLILEP